MQVASRRPKGVTIIAIIMIIVGIVGVIWYIYDALNPVLIGPDQYIQPTFVNDYDKFGVGLGVVGIIVGWALLKGEIWSWYSFVILLMIGIIVSILDVSVPLLPEEVIRLIGGLIVYGVLIYYMHMPDVKSYFGLVKEQPSKSEV